MSRSLHLGLIVGATVIVTQIITVATDDLRYSLPLFIAYGVCIGIIDTLYAKREAS